MGSDTFAYDNNGNQITRNVGTHIYTLSSDAENRLVGVSGYVTASFVYDGDGNRVKGIIGGVTTAYLGNYFEWTGSTTTMKKYYYAGSTRVAERSGSGTMNYLFGDHLGSQTITANNDGTKTGEIRYYPWGTERYTWGTTPTTYHFTGQRLESSLGLYFYGARWYAPAAGRFIEADTIIPNPGNSQSWDRFAYANNNPLKYTDPSGHNPYCDSQYADPEECSGMRQNIKSLDDYILFEYRGPLHETDEYKWFGDYRGKDPNLNIDRWHVSVDAYDDLGTNVYPVLPGVVTKVGWEASLGNYIVIKHETDNGNVYSVYGHLGTKKENGVLVHKDDVVDKTTPIGTLGNTSETISNMEPHLHFEIRYETNVNASEGISGKKFWAFDSSWVYDFFDFGQIYGYVDNATLGKPPLP
jgi:RHS repeat-associated protein